MSRRRPRRAGFVVGTWNVHMGHALPGLAGLIDDHPAVHAWALQEVPAPNRRSLVDALGHHRDDWRIVVADLRGTPALLIRRRPWLTLADHDAPRIRPARHNRARTWAHLHDARTGRDIYLTSVHVDPLGRGLVDAHPAARRMHMRQVQDYATATASRPAGAVVIDLGDWNERLDRPLPAEWHDKSAAGRMAAAGSRPAFRTTAAGSRDVTLDDAFARAALYLQVTRRRLLAHPHPASDHRPVIVRYTIDPLKETR